LREAKQADMIRRKEHAMSISTMTPDELCAHYTSEVKRTEKPGFHYECWFDRGWYRTSKGNAYRRDKIESFVIRLSKLPGFDPSNVEPADEPGSLFKI
jgi:hypothetical protein